jgi:hypothetical protein
MCAFKLPFIRPGQLEIPTQDRAALTARVDLGPFNPPADYSFEPELLPPVPRPIPRTTWQGRSQREWTWHALAFVVLGACFFFAAQRMKPWLRTMAPWLGIGLIAFGVLGFFLGRLRLGPSRYLRHGAALVARVAALEKVPTLLVDGQPLYYAIVALIEHRDPQSGELRFHQVKSPQLRAGNNDDRATTFQVGDYVTAVYLPGEYPQTLQLFEFLDLGPQLRFPRRGRS